MVTIFIHITRIYFTQVAYIVKIQIQTDVEHIGCIYTPFGMLNLSFVVIIWILALFLLQQPDQATFRFLCRQIVNRYIDTAIALQMHVPHLKEISTFAYIWSSFLNATIVSFFLIGICRINLVSVTNTSFPISK